MPLDVESFRKSLLEDKERAPDDRTPTVYDLDAFRDSLQRLSELRGDP